MFKDHAHSFSKATTGSYIFKNNIRHGEVRNDTYENIKKQSFFQNVSGLGLIPYIDAIGNYFLNNYRSK